MNFKGTINGIILQFDPSLSFEQLYQAIEKKLIAANRFFEGSHIIGIEGGSFNEDEEFKLARLFRDKGGMKLLSLEKVDRIKPKTTTKQVKKLKEEKKVNTNKLKSVAVAEKADLNDTKSNKLLEKTSVKQESDLGETIFHRGTLRSGSILRSNGHIVLLGDANAGSELVARGNILVLGRLRGFAHAGSAGDESAYIVAGKLQPTQIRIATHITRPPDDTNLESTYTEIAAIKDGKIIIEPFK